MFHRIMIGGKSKGHSIYNAPEAKLYTIFHTEGIDDIEKILRKKR